ncbi:MAG: DUF2892 domain-containing protein [Oligoflexia bacterium]|nr:DUF2892 domain-containing protein [Oligoflexia bacterium]
MQRNVGKLDSIVRVALGVGLIAWGYSSQNWLGAIGLLPIFTGLMGWCPAYCPLGISTAGGQCCGQKSCHKE